ncbi:MAG: hypothetical protein Phyf2KO_11670 [Phycisphaerales bacterium]
MDKEVLMTNTIGNNITKVSLVLWAICGVIVGAALMVSHWVPLPHPSEDDGVLRAALQEQGNSGDSWTLTHFLYTECPCSLRIMDHVLARGRVDYVSERFVLIGDSMPSGLAEGFVYQVVEPDELLDRYGIESAPLFTVTDTDGAVRYVGGYTARKQGLDVSDLAIVQKLQNGKHVEPLPVYGCAVSTRLKDIVDPLRIKG